MTAGRARLTGHPPPQLRDTRHLRRAREPNPPVPYRKPGMPLRSATGHPLTPTARLPPKSIDARVLFGYFLGRLLGAASDGQIPESGLTGESARPALRSPQHAHWPPHFPFRTRR
jgi:hypothetical protein